MTKSLALALASNIRVNALAPGMILPPPGKGQEYVKRISKRTPIQRTGSPEALTRLTKWLKIVTLNPSGKSKIETCEMRKTDDVR